MQVKELIENRNGSGSIPFSFSCERFGFILMQVWLSQLTRMTPKSGCFFSGLLRFTLFPTSFTGLDI